MKKTTLQTLYELIIFSIPIIAGQIGQMLFGVVDIAVGGRYSTEVVSSLGIGNSLSSPFLVFGLGIAFQIGPMTAQRLRQKTLNNEFYYSSLSINIVLGLLLTLLFVMVPLFSLDLFGFPSELIPLIKTYTLIIAPGLFFSILFQNDKEYLQAHEKTFFANSCILIFNLVNLFLNIAMMFGKWGFPQLGIAGTGISTLICRTGMFLILHFYTCHYFKFRFLKFSMTYIKTIIKEGLPVAFGITAEVFMFSITTIMAGTMDVVASAAHNICLNLGATTFMVPLAMSSAASVKIGHCFGLKDFVSLKKYIWAALIFVFMFMIITCTSYFLIPEFLLSYATDKSEIIFFAIGLMFYLALFQIPDGLQITLQGILRGMSITTPTMWITIVTSLLSVPLSYFLAFKTDLNVRGLWLALSISLTIQTLCYAFLLIRTFRKSSL